MGKGRTVDGATALTMASCTGNLGIVRALLNSSQTDVNQGARNYFLLFPNWPYMGPAYRKPFVEMSRNLGLIFSQV